MEQSYDAVDKLRKRLCEKVDQTANCILSQFPSHDLVSFAIDSLDQSNKHGLTVIGKSNHCLHFIAIQVMIVNINMLFIDLFVYGTAKDDFTLRL